MTYEELGGLSLSLRKIVFKTLYIKNIQRFLF